MLEGIDGTDLVAIDLSDKGLVLPPKTDKIALADADTLLFGVCLSMTETTDVFPREFHTQEEWEEIINSDGFNFEDMTMKSINLEEAYKLTMERLQELCDHTGCCDWELHFTAGRKSFRYTQVDINYKADRQDPTKRPPMGLYDLKVMMTERHPDKAFIWFDYEADDTVVAKKKADPDKYELCAVDKDVLFTLEGRHWNYYRSTQYGIDPKWVEVSSEEACRHHYIQTLTGDSTDGIVGLHRVGKKTAEKLLADLTDEKAMWEVVVREYEKRGRTEGEAIMNMRLVNMHQVSYNTETGEYNLKLWEPTYE